MEIAAGSLDRPWRAVWLTQGVYGLGIVAAGAAFAVIAGGAVVSMMGGSAETPAWVLPAALFGIVFLIAAPYVAARATGHEQPVSQSIAALGGAFAAVVCSRWLALPPSVSVVFLPLAFNPFVVPLGVAFGLAMRSRGGHAWVWRTLTLAAASVVLRYWAALLIPLQLGIADELAVRFSRFRETA
jgi:hypothetical protein